MLCGTEAVIQVLPLAITWLYTDGMLLSSWFRMASCRVFHLTYSQDQTATESLFTFPQAVPDNQGVSLPLLFEHSVSFHHRLTALFHLRIQQICLCPHLMQYANYYDCAILYANIELAKPGISCTAFKGKSNITILVGAVYCMIPCGHFV